MPRPPVDFNAEAAAIRAHWAARITDARSRIADSPSAAAAKVGGWRTTLYAWERPDGGDMSLSTMQAVSTLYGRPIRDVFEVGRCPHCQHCHGDAQ